MTNSILEKLQQSLSMDGVPDWILEGPQRPEVYLKHEPPHWKFWASARFENVSWHYRHQNDNQVRDTILRNDKLFSPRDIVVERLTTRPPMGLAARFVGLLYDRKYRVGPTPVLDAGLFGLVVLFGLANYFLV